jgi:hypothetical protein
MSRRARRYRSRVAGRGLATSLVPAGAWIHDAPIRFVDVVGPDAPPRRRGRGRCGADADRSGRRCRGRFARWGWLVVAMFLPAGHVPGPSEFAVVLIPGRCGPCRRADRTGSARRGGSAIVLGVDGRVPLGFRRRRLDEAADPIAAPNIRRASTGKPVPRRFLAELRRAGQAPLEAVAAEFAAVDAVFGKGAAASRTSVGGRAPRRARGVAGRSHRRSRCGGRAPGALQEGLQREATSRVPGGRATYAARRSIASAALGGRTTREGA